MNERDEVEVARSAYSKLRPLYRQLATEAHDILKTKLQEAGIAPASMVSRAKDVDSFVSKIIRKGYTDPLLQTTDLAGTRVVCAYEFELAKVAEVIESNFDVRERIDKAMPRLVGLAWAIGSGLVPSPRDCVIIAPSGGPARSCVASA